MFNFLKKDEPVNIRFYFSPETNKKRFRVFDQITLDRWKHGDKSDERLYMLMSRFMVDENDQFLGEEKAMKILEKLSTEDVEPVTIKFFNGLNNSAVNPTNGNNSNSTPAPGQAEMLPAGLQTSARQETSVASPGN